MSNASPTPTSATSATTATTATAAIAARCLALTLWVTLCAQARAADAIDPGTQVYQQVCMSCHTPGTAKAPKIGDRARWARLQREGLPHLTAVGWLGVRAMPARGGQPDLTLEAFTSAVVHMARESGVAWPEADEAMMKRIRAEIVKEEKKRKQ
jgi:cytochrome c5